MNNGQPAYPQYLDELDLFPKILTFLLDNPWSFTFDEVPEATRLNERCTDFWTKTGGILWDCYCKDPETFLRPLLKDELPTLAHQDDCSGFICAFYRDIRLFRKWATTAYNEHAQAPLARASLALYK